MSDGRSFPCSIRRIASLVAVLLLAWLCACGGGGGGQGSKADQGVMPDITTQPLDMTVAAGQSAWFSVVVTGTPTPSLQWKSSKDGRTWQVIAGATSTTYSTPTLALADDGTEFCVQATNATGNPTSRSAKLNVVKPSLLSLLAGAVGGGGNVDGTSAVARVNAPNDLAVDGQGNIYVCDTGNCEIRKVTPSGTMSCVAGNFVAGSADGTGSKAGFNFPFGVAVAGDGTLYVADYLNNTIRKVLASGAVTTLAGTAGLYGAANGRGDSARFSEPSGVAVDKNYNVYVADSGNCIIRKISPSGDVITLAGTPNVIGNTDGKGADALFFNPNAITVDGSGNVYVTDYYNHNIRKIAPEGTVSTVAGLHGVSGAADGLGTTARFLNPSGLDIDAAGNLYVADSGNNTIRKISKAGLVSTIAGSASEVGNIGGKGTDARFNCPSGVRVDASGCVYVADSGNNAIRRIDASMNVTTMTGCNVNFIGDQDGSGSEARFQDPTGMAVDVTGNIYLASDSLKVIKPSGETKTLVSGPPLWDVAVDDSGNAYLTFLSLTENIVIKWSPTKPDEAKIFAGSEGMSGSINGLGTAALFRTPCGLALDKAGCLYVTDVEDQTIRKITPTGNVTTLAGSSLIAGSADGLGAAARFNHPSGLALDSAGNVYVADSLNQTIRKITPTGLVSTLAGSAGMVGYVDGTGSAARFNLLGNQGRLTVDGAGNVFVADSRNHTIRKITPDGVVTTVAGVAGVGGCMLGSLPGILNDPLAVALDPQGRLLILEPNAVLVAQMGDAQGGILPTILNQPSDQSVVAGTTATFNLVAAGTPNPTYYWERSSANSTWTAIPGATGTSYQITASLQDDGAQFRAVVSNFMGNVTSSPAALHVASVPAAISYFTPTPTSFSAGQEVLLAFGFQGGTGTIDQGVGAVLNGGTCTVKPTATTTYTLTVTPATGSPVTRSVTATLVAPPTITAFGAYPPAITFGKNSTLTWQVSGATTITLDQGLGAVTGTTLSVSPTATKTYTLTASNGFTSTTAKATVVAFTPSVLAGVPSGGGNGNGTTTTASFGRPSGVAVDSGGNLYVAEPDNTIRKITPAGLVTTLAGLTCSYGSTDGTGAAARFDGPMGLAVDASGNLFVADSMNSTIRKVTPGGVVTTFAGLAGASGSLDGVGTAARFEEPTGLAFDVSGNLYVADYSDNTIRVISPAGSVRTLAGSTGLAGSTDGTGSTARFNFPCGLAVGAHGNLLVADSFSGTLRSVTPAGVVTTLAGTAGDLGYADGQGAAARFVEPVAVATDASGNAYVVDQDASTIRKVTSSGMVTTLAGKAGTQGHLDAKGTLATFDLPSSIAMSSAGILYIADWGNNAIRKITVDVVSTLAGHAGSYGSLDGPGSTALFKTPVGAALDLAGTLYIADADNQTIRTVSPTGNVTTLAGMAGVDGSQDGVGSAARFYCPEGITVGADGTVYVADTCNATIRKISPGGDVTTLAGTPQKTGSSDGVGSSARFCSPEGLAVDGNGNVFVSDRAEHTIRKITPAGVVSTLAGLAGKSGSTDGQGTNARFCGPWGLAVDTAGNLYVADQANHLIRKVTQDGLVTTLAGTAGLPGSTDGMGAAARFNYPSDVAVDASGNVYVADLIANSIRVIEPNGTVYTLAGHTADTSNGFLANQPVLFWEPWFLAVDPAGTNLYITLEDAVIKLSH